MDDKDRYDPQNSDPEDDSEAWPTGLIAGHATGTDSGSTNQGTLAGGVIGATQAARITQREEPEEERAGPVPVIPDLSGEGPHMTGDEGVSAPQREAEADELNG